MVPGFLYSQLYGREAVVWHDHAAFGAAQMFRAETTTTCIRINAWLEVFMSRNWQAVSKAIQQLAARRYAVKSEGMFPSDTHYVLATDEEIERLNADSSNGWTSVREANWVRLHFVAATDTKKADGRVRRTALRL
jgi:hypothetical protein